MNSFDMRQAIDEAKATLRNADTVATDLAIALKGRLRHVHSTWTLTALKKELKNFNMHTGKWKE